MKNQIDIITLKVELLLGSVFFQLTVVVVIDSYILYLEKNLSSTYYVFDDSFLFFVFIFVCHLNFFITYQFAEKSFFFWMKEIKGLNTD